MKKLLKVVLMTCFLIALVGCQKNSMPKERQEVLTVEANKVIDLLNQKDYQGLIEMGDEKMNNPSLVTTLEQQWTPALDNQLGAFKDYGDYSFTVDKEIDVVIVIAKYENTKVQFTISFNQQNQLAGLYFK